MAYYLCTPEVKSAVCCVNNDNNRYKIWSNAAGIATMAQKILRQLPSIDKWLSSESGNALCTEFSHSEVADVMREHLASLRKNLGKGLEKIPALQSDEYFALLRADLFTRRRKSLRGAINATGIIIHTNLGRAPLAREALRAINEVARGYSNLEFDLESGKRGSRHEHVESLLKQLTGAEGALVVNNCAAAVLVALNTFARAGEVLISRGELVEIGGSFRLPDVINRSGAHMIEVGTTNKTTLHDYADAPGEATRVLLSIHPSNYRIVGFTAKPSLRELAKLSNKKKIVLIEDLGSGKLIDFKSSFLVSEPTVAHSVAQGADLVTFSGDKILGGPQAGIIVGRAELIDAIKRNPMSRAMRIDKLSLAALNATLQLYMPPNDPLKKIPVLRMISEDKANVKRRATNVLKKLKKHSAIECSLDDDVSYAGGGSLPMNGIPTTVIRLQVKGLTPNDLAKRLRETEPPVIGRITNDKFVLDFRTVLPRDVTDLIASIEDAIQ